MKKLILCLLLVTAMAAYAGPPAPAPNTASDTSYDATSWDANPDAATKNAIRDKIETILGDVTGLTAGDGVRVDNGTTATPDVHIDYDENTTDLEGTQVNPSDVLMYMDSSNSDDMARGLVSDLPGYAKTVTDADGFTMTAVQGFGYVVFATGAGTIVMPPAVAGANFSVECHAAAAVVLNPDASGTEDTIRLDGTALAQGDSITSGSAVGDLAVCTYYAADTWSCITNSWTDTN